jgi:hypothetical protein
MWPALVEYYDANIDSYDTTLSHNRAYSDGGVLYAQNSHTTIIGANFNHNRADNNGGTMYTEGEKISITGCKFDNTAGNDGGVMWSYQSRIDISAVVIVQTMKVGVIHIDQTFLIIHRISFTYSKAKDGGVIWTDQVI